VQQRTHRSLRYLENTPNLAIRHAHRELQADYLALAFGEQAQMRQQPAFFLARDCRFF
jgi:hypothetical protein